MKYEYGVEYETNGEKPDLPDDVLVDIYEENRWITSDWDIAVGDWNWSAVEKFRIVDERYKPKEQDMGDWYEKGKLPPEGIDCEVYYANHWVRCTTHININGHLVFTLHNDDEPLSSASPESFRPLRTERDALVEKAEMDIHQRYIDMISRHHIHALIDAGWRPIKQQTEDEFTTQAQELTDYVSIYQLSKLYRAGCRFIEKVKV